MRSQEVPRVTGKFVLGVQNEAEQRLTEFCQKITLVITSTIFFLILTQKDDFTHGHHQMVSTEIRLITFFVVEDGEAVYSQRKQELELTVAQITSFS